MNVAPGDQVVIYETCPIARVTGYSVVKAVHYGTPRQLVRLETHKERARRARAYLRGARIATALELSGAREYRHRRTLNRLGLKRPPDSYRRL